MSKASSKSQQIPQEVTYGKNLVKDNSIAPTAKRRENSSPRETMRCTYTSLLVVYSLYNKAS